MLKKFIAGVIATITLFAGAGAGVTAEVECLENTNVGDGLEYIYEVTEINENEVHGIPLNRISCGNKGIFLYKDEIGQDVRIGDIVGVVWGEEEDIFENIRVFDAELAVEVTQDIIFNTPYEDEYDFFTYLITEVNGDEINGFGIDNDGGIVLSKAYDNVDLAEGDVITVVFEKGVEDEILSVQKH